MKIVLYSLLILIAGAAAFFSFTQAGKFKGIQENRLAVLETEKGIESEIAVKEKILKDERALIADNKGIQESTISNVSNFRTSNAALKAEIANLEKETQGLSSDFIQLEKALEEVNSVTASIGNVSLDNLAEKIDEIGQTKIDKTARLEELKTLATGAQKALATSRADADRISTRAAERSARIARNSAQAVVSAVDHEWGFVVIGAGSNSGFTPQTELVIERDGIRIARVTPSSVEPSQTIAEIDSKSLSAGVRIQPGDRVILATPATN